MRFVDTNVLIYAVSTADEDQEKHHRARALLDESDLALSVQVLQEFYVQATRASRPGALTHSEAVAFATSLQRFPIQEVTLKVMRAAFGICERHRLSFWDSAVVAAARELGCGTLYTEDLSAGQEYEGVRVANPFD